MENELPEKNILSIKESISEQLDSAGKWSGFIAIMYLLMGSLIILSLVLLLASFDELMTQIIKFNGVSDEIIDLLEKKGKFYSSIFFLIMAGILYLNGILLFLFSKYSKNYIHKTGDTDTLNNAIKFLQYYLLVSFILGCLSAIPTILTMFFSLGSML